MDKKQICTGCADFTGTTCKVWGENAKHQLFIKHGGECVRNRKNIETKATKKINPLKASKRGM